MNLKLYKDPLQEKLALIEYNENNLSRIQKMIVKAGANKLINQDTRESLARELSKILPYIFRDMGLSVQPDKYDIVRFVDIVFKYYSNLTLSEIKLAFELASVGELDNELPKDRNGNPDKNHYQKFSVEYVTKILNAYRKKKGGVWVKLNNSLPPPKITESEKNKYHENFLKSILKSFNEYQKTGNLDIIMPVRIAEYFIEKGLIKEVESLSKKEFMKALHIYNSRSRRFKIKNITEVKNDILINQIHPIEYRLRCQKTLIVYFNNLIKNKQKLEVILWEKQK